MPNTLDLILVLSSVGLAVGYLVLRRIRTARTMSRDWSSGHVEACDSCPILEIRKAKERIQLSSK